MTLGPWPLPLPLWPSCENLMAFLFPPTPQPQHKIFSQEFSFYFLNSTEELNSRLHKYLKLPLS